MLKGPSSEETNVENVAPIPVPKKPNRILKIERTYLTDDGNEFTRTEIVTDPLKIDLYVKYRTTESVGDMDDDDGWTPKKKKPALKKRAGATSASGLKCGACGAMGHVRTNK